MSGRPEATDGGYHEFGDDVDREAWQTFTPWRPGDPSTSGEAPPSHAAGHAEPDGRSRWLPPHSEPERTRQRISSKGNAGSRDGVNRPGRWWTEDVPERYKPGDRVRSNVVIHGRLGMAHVPSDTRGEVISTRLGVLGGEYATVKFENGYTDEVDIGAIERRSWWG